MTHPSAPNKWKLSGTLGINAYLWNKLQTELGWNHPYGQPFIPAQQQPEFKDMDAPYIVYTYTLQNSGENYLMREEQIGYTIFSKSEEDVRAGINVIDNYLNRYDDSAKDVNAYLASLNDFVYRKFDYKYTYINSASGPQPALEEGGFMDGMVIARVCYTVDSDGKGIRQ